LRDAIRGRRAERKWEKPISEGAKDLGRGEGKHFHKGLRGAGGSELDGHNRGTWLSMEH